MINIKNYFVVTLNIMKELNNQKNKKKKFGDISDWTITIELREFLI